MPRNVRVNWKLGAMPLAYSSEISSEFLNENQRTILEKKTVSNGVCVLGSTTPVILWKRSRARLVTGTI